MRPLRPVDVDTLAPLRRPGWRRWVMGGVATAVAFAVFAAHGMVDESGPCTGTCFTQLSAVSIGLLFGLLVVVAWSPYAGAALAAAFLVVIRVDDVQSSVTNWPAWLYVLDGLLVVVSPSSTPGSGTTTGATNWPRSSLPASSRPAHPSPVLVLARRHVRTGWTAQGLTLRRNGPQWTFN